jgi:hypothetical protein
MPLGEASSHAMDGGDEDPAAAARGLGLVVGPQSAVAHEPGEGALYQPALR